MKISEFEEKAWQIDGVRIVIRSASGEDVESFSYRNAMDEGKSINEWLNIRIKPKVNGSGVIVISGYGEEPHGRYLLRTIRSSYGKRK